MKALRRRTGERGTTLLEVMIAAMVLLIAVVGFLQMSGEAAMATAFGHRRTVQTFLRGALMDRLVVLPRSSLATLASYTPTSVPATAISSYTYVIDACYDVNGKRLSSNAAYSTSYSCAGGTVYQSHVAAKSTGTSTWQLGIYVERVGQGCTASSRYDSWGCSAADLLLTD